MHSRRVLLGSVGEPPNPMPGYDGRMWAYYVTTSANQTIRLLYEEYGMTGVGSTMNVDGAVVPTSLTYTFAEAGEHLVKFDIVGQLCDEFRQTPVRKVYFPLKEITFKGAPNMGSDDYGNAMFYMTDYVEVVYVPGPINETPRFVSTAGSRNAPPIDDIQIFNAARWRHFSGNNIQSLKVRGTFTSIPDGGLAGFNSNSNFKYIWIESPNLASVGYSFCSNMQKLVSVVMNVSVPPTVDTSNLFHYTNSTFKIYIPYSADHSILNAWKAANGWSSYASRMYELTASGEIPE